MFFTIKKYLCATLLLALAGVAFGQQTTPLDVLLKESSDLLQQNQITEAIDLLESGQSEHVDSIEIKNNLSIAYLGADRYEEALALMRSLAQQDRELNIFQHNLAELENSNRGADPIDPIVFVERAPQSEPDEPPVQPQVAEALRETTIDLPAAVIEMAESSALISASEQPSEADIRLMIEAWAAAWSSKDFDNYISFYANDFEARNRSYADWLAFREGMVTKPGPISLQIENFDISIYSYEIRARFDQDYVSDDYSDNIRKLLVIDTRDGFWKIVREATLQVY